MERFDLKLLFLLFFKTKKRAKGDTSFDCNLRVKTQKERQKFFLKWYTNQRLVGSLEKIIYAKARKVSREKRESLFILRVKS